MKTTLTRLTPLLLLPLVATQVCARELYVAPRGADANAGTKEKPFATLTRARDAARALEKNAPVDIILREGVYCLAEPLRLDPRDSGSRQAPVTWRAAAGERVVLSGGSRVTGKWQQGPKGIWSVDLPGVKEGWNFRQLFVNGTRAIRARFPNASAANPFLYALGGGLDHVMIAPGLVKESWGRATDAQINIVPQSRFFNQWNTVTGVDPARGRIDLVDSERHRLIDKGSWFWIEGAQAELDEPNEWCLERDTGQLHYMPTNGVDPNTLEIVAPRLNRLIDVKGDVNAGTHVEQVHFDGFEFRYTTFTLGHIEARVHTDTAVMFENASDCSVRNCRFENIGGYALWLHLDSQRNVFERNTVRNSGGGGVLLTGARFAYMDDSKVYTPGEAAAKVFPILNRITHNTVEHCGQIRYYGGGVHLDSRPFSLSMAPGNLIAHNQFNDLSRNGVFAFRNQGGNVIEYNHIHNAMQTTVDGGCIHFATMNTLNAPNYILNNWLYDAWGFHQNPSGRPHRKLANGIFLDWDTSNTIVKDNWIYNTVNGAVKVIFGGNQNVVTNGNPSSGTVITPPFVSEVGPDGTATCGIALERNTLTGSIISYTDDAHFTQTGDWKTETAVGIVNLFEFKFLTGAAATPSKAVFTLPIKEDGKYRISLLYKPGPDRASNVPVSIRHAGGVDTVIWDMKRGSRFGFAVPVGTYRFRASDTNTVTLATDGVDGKVVTDSVAFVKVEDTAELKTNTQPAGMPDKPRKPKGKK